MTWEQAITFAYMIATTIMLIVLLYNKESQMSALTMPWATQTQRALDAARLKQEQQDRYNAARREQARLQQARMNSNNLSGGVFKKAPESPILGRLF
jgi:hypothetical protein